MSLVVLLRQYALAWTPMVNPTCSTHCMVTFSLLDAWSCYLHASLMVITFLYVYVVQEHGNVPGSSSEWSACPCTMVGTFRDS